MKPPTHPFITRACLPIPHPHALELCGEGGGGEEQPCSAQVVAWWTDTSSIEEEHA